MMGTALSLDSREFQCLAYHRETDWAYNSIVGAQRDLTKETPSTNLNGQLHHDPGLFDTPTVPNIC